MVPHRGGLSPMLSNSEGYCMGSSTISRSCRTTSSAAGVGPGRDGSRQGKPCARLQGGQGGGAYTKSGSAVGSSAPRQAGSTGDAGKGAAGAHPAPPRC